MSHGQNYLISFVVNMTKQEYLIGGPDYIKRLRQAYVHVILTELPCATKTVCFACSAHGPNPKGYHDLCQSHVLTRLNRCFGKLWFSAGYNGAGHAKLRQAFMANVGKNSVSDPRLEYVFDSYHNKIVSNYICQSPQNDRYCNRFQTRVYKDCVKFLNSGCGEDTVDRVTFENKPHTGVEC